MNKNEIERFCHKARVIPKHRNARAHIRWLAKPRMGLITSKYQSIDDCCGGDQLLARRIRRMRPASIRVVELAQPSKRNTTKKYADLPDPKIKCACAPLSATTSTRLDQLAMPYVR